MTSILENETVLKYFCKGPCLGEPKIYKGDCEHKNCQGLRVLSAMQEPIKAGEKVLYIQSDGSIVERIGTSFTNNWDTLNGFHAYYLRLPDRFQPSSEKKECGHWPVANATSYECVDCGERVSRTQPPPAPSVNWYCPKGCQRMHGQLDVLGDKCACECHKPASEKCDCGSSEPKPHRCNPRNAPDPAIEAKIKEMTKFRKYEGFNSACFASDLRELVELARRSDR